MYERLFRRQWQLDDLSLAMHAKAVGLDSIAFRSCMNSVGPREQITKQERMAAQLGITSTPTFVIGRLDGLIADLKMEIRGAQDYQVFAAALESMLQPK